LTAFSQTDTASPPVKCFPVPVVKLIVKDLLSGDSAKAELKLVNKEIVELERKINLKDSVISTMKLKEENYINIISKKDEKFSILEDHTKKIELQLKKSRVMNKFKSFISVGVIGVLTFFLITK